MRYIARFLLLCSFLFPSVVFAAPKCVSFPAGTPISCALNGTQTDTKFCTYNATTGKIDCTSSGSGSTLPAGNPNAVQYNGAGIFAGDETKFSFNGTNVGIGTTNGKSLFDVNSLFNVFTAGNVGINNTAPTTKLYVGPSGSTSFTVFPYGQGVPQILAGNATGASIGVTVNDGVDNHRVKLFEDETNGYWGLIDNYDSGAQPFIIAAGNRGELLRIGAVGSTSNNVGIGTTDTSRGILTVFGTGSTAASNVLALRNSANTNLAIMTNAGNLGIGTLSPGVALDVVGSIRASTNIGIGTYSVCTTSGNCPSGGGGSGTINSGTINRAARYSGSTTLDSSTLIADDGTNVGIGSTAPQNLLDILGTGRMVGTSELKFGNDAGDFGLKASAVTGGNLVIRAGGINRTFINSAGNIGIGSDTPGQNLDVNGIIRVIANGQVNFGDDNTDWIQASKSGATPNLDFYTNGVRSMDINSAGNVGIGTFSATDKSHVWCNTSSACIAKVQNINASGYALGSQAINDAGHTVYAISTGTSYSTPDAQGIISSTNTLGFSTNNGANAAVNIVASNVGIGSVSPGKLLDVFGTTRTTALNVNGVSYPSSATNDNSLTTDGTNIVLNSLPSCSSGSSALQYNTTTHAYSCGSIGINTGSFAGQVAYYATASSTISPISQIFTNGNNIGIGTTNYNNAIGISGGAIAIAKTDGTPFLNTVFPAGSLVVAGNVGIGTTLVTTSPLSVMTGNVGIGTWVPGKTLDVIGTIRASTDIGIGTYSVCTTSGNCPSGGGGSGTINSGTTNRSARYSGATTLDSSTKIFDDGTNVGIGTIAPRTSVEIGVQTMNINGANVGIGSITPGYPLDVNGGLRTIGNTNNTLLNTTGGNVGIGSLTPGGLLDVAGKSRTTAGGHIITTGTAPTVVSNDCGSTAQGTIVSKSTDNSGTVTVGTLTVTSCAVTFASAWTVAPNCVVVDDTSILTVRPGTISTTKLTINSTTSMSGDNVTWICQGNE